MSVQIEVTDLHKTYGKNEVLKGISAKFNKGDVVCIIGPSGSGKSIPSYTKWFRRRNKWRCYYQWVQPYR